jgi:hypothetical protein
MSHGLRLISPLPSIIHLLFPPQVPSCRTSLSLLLSSGGLGLCFGALHRPPGWIRGSTRPQPNKGFSAVGLQKGSRSLWPKGRSAKPKATAARSGRGLKASFSDSWVSSLYGVMDEKRYQRYKKALGPILGGSSHDPRKFFRHPCPSMRLNRKG